MNASTLPPANTRRILVAAFVVIMALLGVGYWYYRTEVQAIRQHHYEEIASIAKLKVGQIVQWRNERLADVTREASSPTFIAALGKIAENAETPEVRERTMKVLALARSGTTYANTFVLSPSGQVLFSAGDGPVSIEAATQQAVEAARANPGGALSDFFRTPKGEVDIDAVEAVRDAGGNVLGFIVLRSRADDYLYPLIQAWPTPSRSSETLLVEREGENVLFLNELRHRSKTALSFRNSLSQTHLPAVQGVLGKRGFFEGKDYRNVEVLADLSPIPGTTWFIVAKVDRDEIMAEAGYRAASIGTIVGAFILLTSFAAAFAYKQQHARLLGELYESERHQRQAQELFRSILYSIADGVLTADTSGRILEMNTVAERLTGWTEAEARGKPLDEVFVIINQETRATVPNPAATVLREGRVVGLANHTVLIARDGSECPIADSGAPICDESGLVQGVVLVFSDATAQDALLKAKTEAEEANEAKNQFIAVLSHELRTPLTLILLSSSALEAEEDVPEGVRAEMRVIRRNVELEMRLIDDLLDVTRISSGKIQLQQEVVDAHACLRNALEICQSEIAAKHLNVSMKLEADQPQVWADPVRLQQVFWNLLRNAVKFTPEGGAISVCSANIDSLLRMEVSDTGVGIDPAVLPRIFNAFEQGEQSKARSFGGLGLGLSISKALVDLHHGTLSASSEGRNKGSTFTLEMATVPEAKAPPVAPRPMPLAPSGSKKILLVEDHADTLRILTRMLQKWGYAVKTADSVRSALEEAAKEPFDLLVSDIGLPDGSGLEIMQQAKKLYSVSGIAISGFGTEEDIRKSRAAGFGEHLVKPVSIQALHEAVQRIASEPA